jgi:uncharacterized protein (TIGR02646 family)
MRSVRRPPSIALPTLGPEGSGGKLAGKHVQVREQNPAAELKFPEHWNEADVRGALYAMHGRVCVYCQCDLPQNDAGDVEHFRPKSIYWWLAYVFSNYFLRCSTCNRVRKREKFPLPAGGVPLSYANRDLLDGEVFALLHPERDPVENWVKVDYENELCPVLAKDGLLPGSEPARRVEETVRFFKLNENVRLIRQRYETVNEALKALGEARNGDDAQREKVRRMASRYKPHGVAIRQMLEELAPEWLPSPEEELSWLVQDFLRDLDLAAKALAQAPGSQVIKKTAEEVLWALAVLWKHPPAASAAQVEAWLQAASWRDAVAEYHAGLTS